MKLCRCHQQPMRPSPGSNGGWRCVIREREKQLRYWHKPGGGYIVRRKRDLAQQRSDITERLNRLREEATHVVA